MAIVLMLAAVLVANGDTACHVRSSDAQVARLIQAGLEQSQTFRRLVEALDASDVIVYVKPKVGREALGGYLAHNVLNGGPYRYLRVAIAMRGSEARLISVLAHELQHALEVAQHVSARDAEDVQKLFARLAVSQGCAIGNCFETDAARDVEEAVLTELKRTAR